LKREVLAAEFKVSLIDMAAEVPIDEPIKGGKI
jgi:hypothetical protein